MKGMGHKILVIEDSADIADLVALHLGDLGCEVKVVTEGQSGLQLARGGGYDLIILDLMLPGGLGGLPTSACQRRLHSDLDADREVIRDRPRAGPRDRR